MVKNIKKIISDLEEGFKVVPVDGATNRYVVKEYNQFGGYDKWEVNSILEFDEKVKSWFMITPSLGHGIMARTDTEKSTLKDAVHQVAVETARYRNIRYSD